MSRPLEENVPRYAIKTPNHHTTWQNMLDIWREADQIGLFESAWNWDHLYPLRSDPHGTSLDGWVTLSALARETSRLKIGSMVKACTSDTLRSRRRWP